jgi:hypothetical protein
VNPRTALGGARLGVLSVGVVLACLSGPVPAAADSGSWWLDLSTTGYAYQTLDAAGAEVDHLEGYQHLSGAVSGLASGRMTLRFSARLADDLRTDAAGLDAARLHGAQLLWRPSRALRLTAGRQFLQAGAASLVLDGLRGDYRPSARWQATAWFGARAPYDLAFDPGCWRDDTVAGARLTTTLSRTLRLGLSTAYRERGGRIAERPLGLDAALTPSRELRFSGRADYDLEREQWRRSEIQALWRAAGQRPEIRLQALGRRPSIDAASWFSRFSAAERIRLLRLVVHREFRPGWGGEAEYVGTQVDERGSTHLGLAAVLPLGRVGWSVRSGDAGDENGLYGEVGARLADWLHVAGTASHLTYSFWENDPLTDDHAITTLTARLRADLKPGLRVTAAIQRLETPDTAHDVRLLLGVNLSAASGAARFGLTEGGERP